MTERERATNHELHALGDAYRLGRLSREEYRVRRRQVLTALRESTRVTARNVVTQRSRFSAAGGTTGGGGPPSAPALIWRKQLILLVVVVVLLLLLLLFWLLRFPDEAASTSAATRSYATTAVPGLGIAGTRPSMKPVVRLPMRCGGFNT